MLPTSPLLRRHNGVGCLFLYLLSSFLALTSLSACSSIAQSPPVEAHNSSVPANVSASGSEEWAMEGYSPQRDRATADDVQPPLSIQREVTVGGDTRLGSPVGVARGLLFVEGTRQLHVFALESGKEQWNFDLPGSYLSPAVAGNSVFVRAESDNDGYVLALSVDAGLKLWQFKFPQVGSIYGDVGGHVTSPVVAGGLVLVGASQSLRALRVETGTEVWVFDAKLPIVSSATVADDSVYFTDFNALYALDLKSGAKRWSFEHGTLTLLFAPVVSGDEVIITSYNTVYALNRRTGEVSWTKTIGTESLLPCGAAGERVYIKSVNQLYALDRLTGETAWTYQGPGFVSMPAVARGQIYVITRTGSSGQLRALRLADGQESWQTESARLANAAPVVAGGRVYVRTEDGSVLVYDQKRKKE